MITTRRISEFLANRATREWVCESCRNPYEQIGIIFNRFCPSCAEIESRKWDENEKQRKRQMRLEKFNLICPPIMKDTDPNLLMKKQLSAVLNWKYAPCGLFIHGVSGKGKTRTLFLLLKRLIVEEGRNVTFLTAHSFSDEIECSRTAIDLKHLKDRWVNTELLVIDDLGHERMTSKVECSLSDIIDRRTSSRKPIIVTTNFIPAKFIERFAERETGERTMRRISQYCEEVSF